MNKLNEDEAIQQLQYLKNRKIGCGDWLINCKDRQAIETILDLYQQEKEKNKELENKYNDLKQIEEKHRIENGELRTKINELEREIEGLKQTFIIHDDIDNHIPHID